MLLDLLKNENAKFIIYQVLYFFIISKFILTIHYLKFIEI